MTKILVAEDSNVIQRMLKTILSKDKSIDIVGTALNGNEAVHMNDTLDPDLIIMDYRMPQKNGAEAIKSIMSSKPKPILVLSSVEPEEKVKQEVMALGAVGFMSKPKNLNFDDIATRLVMNIKTLSRIKTAKRTY